jgi:hypothetical protein
MLGVSRRTLFRVMGRGDFPVVRIESCPRIPVAALRHWVDTQLRGLELGSEVRHG